MANTGRDAKAEHWASTALALRVSTRLVCFCTLVALVFLITYQSVSTQLSAIQQDMKENSIAQEGPSTILARSRLLVSNVFSNHNTTTRSWTTPTGVEIQTRIVGGKDVTDLALFPSYGFNAGEGLCGGTLIHPDIVMTAAHCGTAFKDGWQQGGITINGADSQLVAVAQSVPHPDYDPGTEYNDIMLVKLAEPIAAPLQKLNFDPNVPPDGTTVTVIGYGDTTEGGQGSFQLQQVQSTTASFDTCNGYFGTINKDIQVCMDSSKGKDSCQGDSGGPLMLSDGTQIGIVSYGAGCARSVSSWSFDCGRNLCDGARAKVTQFDVSYFSLAIAPIFRMFQHLFLRAFRDTNNLSRLAFAI